MYNFRKYFTDFSWKTVSQMNWNCIKQISFFYVKVYETPEILYNFVYTNIIKVHIFKKDSDFTILKLNPNWNVSNSDRMKNKRWVFCKFSTLNSYYGNTYKIIFKRMFSVLLKILFYYAVQISTLELQKSRWYFF